MNIINKIAAATSSPPPPPQSTPKSSKKTLYAIIAVVLIAVLIVAVYLAMNNPGTNNSGTTPTPNPSSSVTPSPTPGSTALDIAGASSLQYTVALTDSSGGAMGSYTFSAKNAGTSNMMIRVEFVDPSSQESFIYLVNGAQQKAWMITGGESILLPAFADEWANWQTTFEDYQDNLADWNGVGDWTYTIPGGETIRISNISVNPSLPDSLFEPT